MVRQQIHDNEGQRNRKGINKYKRYDGLNTRDKVNQYVRSKNFVIF